MEKEIFCIKGQLISKAIYGLLTSPKKRTYEFVLFAFLPFTANKSNSPVRFLGGFHGSPICFLILSDLYCYFGRIIDPTVSLLNFLTFDLIAATQTNTWASLMVPAFWQKMDSQELTETGNGCFSKLGYILYIF